MLRLAHSVTLSPGPAYPLHVTANCYRAEGNARGDASAVTLILLHSAGFHKEMFEPTIAELFSLAGRGGAHHRSPAQIAIREAWAVECPTHGYSAVLNEDILRSPEWDEKFCAEEYAKAAYAILTLPRSAGGAELDPIAHNFVGIGHSMGSVSMIYLAARIPVKSIFLIEPTLCAGRRAQLDQLQEKLFRRSYERKDTWYTREIAEAYLRSQAPNWSSEVLALFIKHALRPHQAAQHKVPYNGVTLACSRNQEAVLYRAVDDAAEHILDSLSTAIPIHLIFGEIANIMPLFIQEAIAQVPTRQFASITRVEGATHLVPQEKPELLAQMVYSLLMKDVPSDSRRRAML